MQQNRAQWSELDFNEEVWTIPKERMTAAREHQVPLSDAALAVLACMQLKQDALTKLNGESKIDPFVFGGTKGQMLSDMTLTALIRRMNSDEEKPVWTDAAEQGSLKHDLIHVNFRPSGLCILPIPVHSC